MAYRNQYNFRKSNRFNNSGQFLSGGELAGAGPIPGANPPPPPLPPMPEFGKQQEQPFNQQQQQPQQQQLQALRSQPNQQNLQLIQTTDTEMKEEQDMDTSTNSDDQPRSRPYWMKSRLFGVKKISNKERRRRQNESLRRLLTPKNALMALNEMMPGEQLASQFKVAPAVNNQYYKAPNAQSFCADITIDGNTYKGYGENKMTARNAAAEQALRDLVIKRMSKLLTTAAGNGEENAGAGAGEGEGDGEGEGEGEEPLPMIQLASFALHKLFSEWEYEGHKVPPLKPNSSNSVSDNADGVSVSSQSSKGPKPIKTAADLPLNASAMHPCMLLTYMRPRLEYRELAVDGNRPQNMVFTMGVDVDGATYIGKASNKKEARKAAAKAACQALFNVHFDEVTTANAPVLPAATAAAAATASATTTATATA